MRGLAAPIDEFEFGLPSGRGWALPAASLLFWFVVAVALPMLLGRQADAAPELLVGVAVVVPFLVTLFTSRLAQALTAPVIVLCIALLLGLLLSTLGAAPDFETALAIAIVPIYIVTSAAFALCPRDKLVRVFRLVSAATLVVLIVSAGLDGDFKFFFGSYQPWERLDGGNHPNYFALTALVGALFAVAYREPFRLLLITIFFYLSYMAQSRTTMICIAACGFYALSAWLPVVLDMIKRKPILFPALVTAVLGVFAASGAVVFELFVGISRKGEEAGGLSGREQLWARAVELFSADPVFGHGYRSQYTESLLGGVFAHNMWLSSLVEIGMVGTLVLIGAIVFGFVVGFRFRKVDSGAELGLLVLFVSLIYGMAESRYINTGNPLSILFLFSLGYLTCLSQQQPGARGRDGPEEYLEH